MKKTVVVTGCAGFLGSHLAKRHLDGGDRVIGVDDFSSSRMFSDHMLELHSYKLFRFFRDDICDLSDLDLLLGMGTEMGPDQVDLIYNFACPASPPRYQAMPIHTLLTCTQGTNQVLKLAERYGSVVVHASTSEVYGDPEVNPQFEKYRGNVNSYGPRACYDEGKRAAEALCYDYFHKHQVDVRLVRIFNTYGPNMDPWDGRVVSNFIVQGIKGEDLTVYGKGNQTRSFCYVDDLVRGIVALGALEKNPGTPINVGNPTEFTVLELARLVQERFNSRIVFRDLPVDDPMQRRPDITLAKELLGWEPRVRLEDGLTRTIEYFMEQVKQPLTILNTN